MTQSVEEYIKKRMLEQISEHDKETARFFYKNGASVELVKNPIPTLSVELIEQLSRQLTAVNQ